MSRNVLEEIATEVRQTPVVLYMKGSRHMPQCGFSATLVAVLNDVGVAYKDINVLADPDVREGIKRFSDWPTVPQLYFNGEFIGGCDIVREMHSTGELQKLLAEAPRAQAG
jgi:monothiol glutaredoxin